VLQEPVGERREPREAVRRGPGRRDDDLVEDAARGLHRRELELLLRAEVREEAALGHPHVVGEPCEREPLDALHRREARRVLEDRLARPQPVAPSRPRGPAGGGLVAHA
jgi:hypothetical protein